MATTCCGTKTPGKRVGEITLAHLLREEALPLAEGREWFFCADPGCGVVYFSADGATLSKDALRVRVGLKESTPPRGLCYCFGYSFEDVERDAGSAKASRIAALIADKCRQGLDRCEQTNPHGSCCLGDVQRVFREARASERPSRRAEQAEDRRGCCDAMEGNDVP